jgi:hypothetical protein
MRAWQAFPFRLLTFFCMSGALPFTTTASERDALERPARPIRIVVDRQQVIARFDPRTAFGATIDAHGKGESAAIFTRKNVEAMLSAGFQPLSYRLETELSGEAWHWNPEGSWSDASHHQGYWISSATMDAPIRLSYGYRLPRRGNTVDQAHNDSYSRIDDGDEATFWKSNPYLDERFTRKSNAIEPQWLLVDLARKRAVDVVRISWGTPFAIDYRIESWTGEDPINNPAEGEWRTFRTGTVTSSGGGMRLTNLGERRRIRFLRVVMTRSSNTGTGSDLRDRLGFAVREISAGALRSRSASTTDRSREPFLDWVRHGAGGKLQSVIWVSSTDPWHRSVDIDRATEQLGLDAVYATGLTRGTGAIVPVPLLYGVPEDAVAEIRYLRSRHYPISFVEMGEEPDGQTFSPESYGALYEQWSEALHAVDPTMRLGGPCFQSTNDIVAFWRDVSHRDTSWIGRFVEMLRHDGRIGDLSFFSFEWYPFDDLCVSSDSQLALAPAILRRVLQAWRDEGLPETIPWIATEYGYSSYAGEPEVDLHGAILNADFAADFLSLGGAASYFYGYEPDVLIREERCPTWGNLILFLSDGDHRIRQPLATYYAARLLTTEWVSAAGEQRMHRVRLEPTTPFITAYAVERPDGQYSLLIFNKDPAADRQVTISDAAHSADAGFFAGAVELIQYGPRQYRWHALGEAGFARPDEAPERHSLVDGGAEFRLPSLSITVIRGVASSEARRPAAAKEGGK